ncbi:tubulin polyglutamylase TTLL4 [Tachysurus vachellii]|uniref:tubulin polyglutamylase TTLL4 n=1 Tax=Tachysurus vachellii TaxID=175792 RepID=UPI00296A9FF6|nr:tubulin polyglutamylase TTLL4 [Tachysurus vachellii]XP_060732720.1 tubulin polyglutamylase TTLL4 [Tachysurus vachellii]
MASIGAEDFRKGASQPTLSVQAKSAIVHLSRTRASSAPVESKWHQPSSFGDSLPRPHVKVPYERPHNFSGISSQRASPSVPAGVVRAKSTGARPSSSSSSRDTRPHSAVSKSSVNVGGSSVVCQSTYPLEPVIHAHQSHRHLSPLRLKSRLLGKRAFVPPLSIYPPCPSPPKTSSHKVSVIVEKTMPANQSYPWSRGKLRSNSNGVIRSSTAKVPIIPRLETKHLKKSSALVSAKADTIKNSQTVVPLEDKYTDVPPNHISDFSEYDKLVAEDAKENEHIVECCVGHGASEAPQRMRKASSEVEFTPAVRKLTKNISLVNNRTLNGLSGSLTANFDSQSNRREVRTDANSATQASAVCLLNGSEEFYMDTHPSDALCLDENSPSDGMNQDSTCAISEDIVCIMDSPQSPTVYSVMNQISAIHLTKDCCRHTSEEDPSQCPLTVDDGLPDVMGQVNVGVLRDVDSDELADELENVCSDNDDGSESDASLAPSMASSSNIDEPMRCELEDAQEVKPALVPSLFPFMPPTLYFSRANETVELLPLEQRSLLKWKISSVTPNIVRQTVTRSHFKVTKKSHDWLGCWGHHMKSAMFNAIREYQKLNHFPGSFQIGRKDRLWRNLSKMQTRFGKREFGFFPRSFVLPQDMKLLKKAWEDGGCRQKWIIKPPASARGIGIQVIHKWSQIPRKRPLLVQRYLHKPYLISGNKFDLRIYVYVTSYDPLRVYIFNDGLVRFASCKYSSSMKSLDNKFMHLTNYSVNKKNSEYQANSDDKACQGHKWALKALWQYLDSKGIITSLIWEKIKDMVIKTIIASDPYVNKLVKKNVRSPYSCHELFGFDIMLDENLKPWVLEVNISPSLHSNSPLDVSIKGQMIRDVLNLAGFVLPKKEDIISSSSSGSSSSSSLNEGAQERPRSDLYPDEKLKRAFYLTQKFEDQDFCSTILEVLTPDDVRVLAESEDEMSRLGDFERVFPSPASFRYLRFFEHPRYLNILLNHWEQKYYLNRREGIELLRNLCQKRVHLGNLADSTHNWSSKSNPGHQSDLQCTKTVLTKSSATVSQCVSSQLDEDDDDEWSDHDVQSVTSSIPDISLKG